RRSGAVAIELAGGKTVGKRVLDPKGEGENPMTDEDLKRKFMVNCEAVVGKEKCEPLVEVVWNFDKLADARELFSR
ncbi:MAG: MmgE/PrpD family protein, partial [Betaproteobacteria bacterium]|nr:MmgE/PrpD family protein [Betaproteobacteria bacterium]